ncbi:MAG: CoA ester lyase [Hyphomicrobiales bacterium]|nr:CoA ester lyase [Hyphomicrobiales bacterium]MDE2115653.1 CoA ester lyase [Hyphomicrobiales bacterium]
MRSLLFVPGDSPRKLAKGLEAGADALLIDLEDSVALANKPAARLETRAFIERHAGQTGVPAIFVRVNAVGSGLIDDDLKAALLPGISGIMLPKCCGARDLQQVSAQIAVGEAMAGCAPNTFKVLAIATETAASLFVMGSFAGASQRLAGLAWGAEDLAADIGALSNRDEQGQYTPVFVLARTLTLAAASAAQVAAIDTVYTRIGDEDGLRAECLAARRDGFSGKMAIHPGQIATINAAFTPSEAERAWSQQIVDTFAANPGAGVLAIDGKMIDEPHLVQARRILGLPARAR